MVANYTEVRSATLDAEAPVPATFRAHAIDRFNAARDGDHQLYLDWLGVPGREIAKAPQDPATAEAIGHAAATGQTAPRSEGLDDADGTVCRTLATSVARPPACVDCPNIPLARHPPFPPRHRRGVLVLDGTPDTRRVGK